MWKKQKITLCLHCILIIEMYRDLSLLAISLCQLLVLMLFVIELRLLLYNFLCCQDCEIKKLTL